MATSERFRLFLKRLLDVSVSVALLAILWPVLLLTAAAVRLTMGRPVLFCQKRPGMGGRPFTIWKFRSMRDARDERGRPLSDSQRLTRMGTFLRKTSLDELPELFQVVRGEMSLVGPRPLCMEYLPYYTEREQLRHTMRPGITGWAQVHGRNEVSWDARLAYDVWYVENWSLWLDLKILAMTAVAVFRQKGVVVDASSTLQDLNQERAHMTPKAES